MTHDEAIREMAVERYLLEEMTEETRTAFEEHYFECTLCAEDLAAGRMLLDAGRRVVQEPAAAPSPSWRNRRFGPWVVVPALAAALLVMLYQSTVLLPHLHRQVAQLDSPELLNTLVLANANARGDGVPAIVAPGAGSIVLAVDIPAREGTAIYLCSLLGPTGAAEWTIPVPTTRVENTVSLRVPVDKVHAGLNTLVVRAQSAAGGPETEVARYPFQITIQSDRATHY